MSKIKFYIAILLTSAVLVLSQQGLAFATLPTMDGGGGDIGTCAEGKVELSFAWDVNHDGCTNSKDLIAMGLRLAAGVVGIAVVGGIALGGMLYASSNGNAAKAQQGITTIVNSVIGLLLFIFLFAITNFLVPGGILG